MTIYAWTWPTALEYLIELVQREPESTLDELITHVLDVYPLGPANEQQFRSSADHRFSFHWSRQPGAQHRKFIRDVRGLAP